MWKRIRDPDSESGSTQVIESGSTTLIKKANYQYIYF
jgi:hypothetical protein